MIGTVLCVTGSRASSDVLPQEIEGLLAELLGEARSAELAQRATRLESALSAPAGAGEFPAAVVDELRSAVELVREGQTSAAVSALLAARSAIGAGSP